MFVNWPSWCMLTHWYSKEVLQLSSLVAATKLTGPVVVGDGKWESLFTSLGTGLVGEFVQG